MRWKNISRRKPEDSKLTGKIYLITDKSWLPSDGPIFVICYYSKFMHCFYMEPHQTKRLPLSIVGNKNIRWIEITDPFDERMEECAI